MKSTYWKWSQPLLSLLFFSSLIALSRWIPHPPNFTPVLAVALFCGAKWGRGLPAFALPIVGMFLSDLVLGFHDLMLVVYLSLIPMVVWASYGPRQHVRNALVASVWFFVVTNGAVWWTGSVPYPHTWAGLTECFAMALPFFHYTLISTLVYLGVLEAGSRVLARASQSHGFAFLD